MAKNSNLAGKGKKESKNGKPNRKVYSSKKSVQEI